MATQQTDQAKHCLDQIKRFANMLQDGAEADRPRDTALAQLAFNLGRYAEINHQTNPATLRTRCLDHIIQFASMLDYGPLTLCSGDSALIQIALSLGQFVEITQSDGRALWGMLDACTRAKKYDQMVTFAAQNQL